jgi:hypothetical protein
MHANANAGSAEIGNRRREAGEKFQINGRIDPEQTHAQQDPEGPEEHRRHGSRWDGQDVVLRDQFKDIDDEAILFEGGEIDIFGPHHLDGAPNGIGGEDGRPLFRQFDDDDPPGIRTLIDGRFGQELAKPGEQKADRDKDEAIGLLKN